jgi:ketosteroid isomerase-like protein
MAEGFREVLGAWEELCVAAEAYRELDAERVLVLFQFSGRGKRSGLEVGQIRTKAAQVFHVRDGKVTRLVHYLDHEHALAELGLPPEHDERE